MKPRVSHLRTLPSTSRGGIRQVLALGLLAAVGGLVLALSASSSLPPADFAFRNGAEVSTLDPATVTSVPEGRIVRALFEGLTVKDPKTVEPLPGMAESWEISADGLVYTFRIREGARWTNGDPVTAHDFVYSWRRVLHPETAAEYAYALWYVRGAREYTANATGGLDDAGEAEDLGLSAPTDYLFRVELEAPTPYFLDLVGFYPLYPVNRRNLEEAQERWQLEWLKSENLVTNGPYQLRFRRINDRIRLVKNPDYWDAKNVAFETIDAFSIDHLGTSLNLFLTGELDWVDRPPASLIPRLREREGFDPAPFFGASFFRFNCTRPPFDDPRVRRALSLCVDRRAIVLGITKAGERPSYSFTPPGLAGYPLVELRRSAGGSYEENLARDLEEARRLLAEAGFGPGGEPFPTFEILFNTDQTNEDIAEVVADGWQRELGLKVKLLNQEWKVYLDSQRSLRYDVSRSSWIGDYADPNTFLDVFVTGGENSRTGWGNGRYDELIASAAREADEERRFALLAEAEAILLDELPILPLYDYVTRNLVNPRLGGFHENLRDEHFCKFWYWMDDEELAAKRAALADPRELAPAPGPAGGLYPPSHAMRQERQ